MKVVARCEKCGRGFVTRPAKEPAFDPFVPVGKRGGEACGGRIVPVTEPLPEPPDHDETRRAS